MLLRSLLLSTLAGLSFAVPTPRQQELVDKHLQDKLTRQTHIEGRDECTIYEPYWVGVEWPEFDEFDPSLAEIFRYRQQQSVNLGSWFVAEKWMVPSIFKCAAGLQASELDIARGWNEDDFRWLSEIGINTVRIPIGYWGVGNQFLWGTDFDGLGEVYGGQWSRIRRAIHWASLYNIGVLLDLHGAPGSANGQHISGTSDTRVGLFADEFNLQRTEDVLVYLTEQLAYVNNMVGIQLINEPQYGTEWLEAIYDRWLGAMRAVPGAEDFPLYIHDAFDLGRYAGYVAGRSDFVVEDHHSYFVYTDEDAHTPAWLHGQHVNGPVRMGLEKESAVARRNLVIGEWSCALTAESLAGEDDPANSRWWFCSSQEAVYRNVSAGYYFWSYKTEDCDQNPNWCFLRSVGDALPATFSAFGPDNPPHINAQETDEIKQLELPDIDTILGDLAGTFSSWFGLGAAPVYRRDRPHEHGNGYGHDDDDHFDAWYKHNGGIWQTEETQFEDFNQTKSAEEADSDSARLAINNGASQAKPMLNNMIDPATFIETLQSTSSYGAAANNDPAIMSEASARVRGYSDGFGLARKFAAFNLSKVGFTGQWISSNVRRLIENNELLNENIQTYSDHFGRGLQDAEAEVLTRKWMWETIFTNRGLGLACAGVIALESILTPLIVKYVPYTEIDWKAYMQQVKMFREGSITHYDQIEGDTGPLVYPAAHVYSYTALYHLTNAGTDIELAQYIFTGIYLLTLTLILDTSIHITFIGTI
ncbi:hypothetical protein E3Q23_02792 [Wallemia mellicola]|uniref:Glycoside hydrolase n=1 Tax=Wallemia mellicola TaxID=1708541 RepID=A0A4T0TGA4_9BASI|nr:hypothetical protein E3Q24_04024 [Wallemia mellicola]TIB74087.1 hypothetical protein E3Q23_02792 [Wallemia mellicola]TIB83328.1 glycoside hydrolase [Wallemia mellicola]TIB86198.1 glycoside hydrolase [Wallemia mellicola]TIC16481.1 glycoside hydrolase [Wallemia mellicola]